MQNVQLQCNEHEHSTDKNLECTKHLNENDNHEFKWSILSLVLKFSLNSQTLDKLIVYDFRTIFIENLGYFRTKAT